MFFVRSLLQKIVLKNAEEALEEAVVEHKGIRELTEEGASGDFDQVFGNTAHERHASFFS